VQRPRCRQRPYRLSADPELLAITIVRATSYRIHAPSGRCRLGQAHPYRKAWDRTVFRNAASRQSARPNEISPLGGPLRENNHAHIHLCRYHRLSAERSACFCGSS
jgi:hypothetical protein